MQRKNIKSVLDKISSGDFNSRDEQVAKYWIHQLNQKKQSGYSDQDLDRISEEMWQVLAAEGQQQRRGVYKLWPGIAAAIAVIILGAGLFYYGFLNEGEKRQVSGKYANDVNPGKMGATLTLASGKKIRLSGAANGEIAKEAGITVTKTADGQLIYEIKSAGGDASKVNTLSTEKGETYIVTLPDKSKVWLNAASSLTYSTRLNEGGRRKVKLEGEAYFEIARDKRHPFIVQTAKQEVEVLGTHFNVNCYSNEPDIRTTLVEGSVKVADGKSVSILKPNQQSVLNEHGINIRQVNAEDEISWKDGVFLFQDETLASIMRRISRWYNVDVVFADGVDRNQLYGGGVSRYNNVSAVLEMLESTKDIHFKIEGRRILVMK